MKISYRDSISEIPPSKLEGFLLHWDFTPPERTLEQILRNSSQIAIAIDDETSEVVGYVCAISDGVSCTYISHLEVREPYRSHGIGSGLVDHIITKVVPTFGMYLSCAPSLESFYARKGFRKIVGMSKRATV